MLVLLLVAAAVGRAQGTAPSENVKYNWAFVARSGGTEHRTLGIVTKDTALKSGDQFKLYVNLAKKCYVYVIYKSSANAVTVLFPYGSEFYDTEYSLDKNYYIPKGRDWFTLDKSPGTETFYVLASSERLPALEKALVDYRQADASGKEAGALRVVNEIKETKKQFRTFSTLAERPISIAGNVRGETTKHLDPDRIDIATLASEVSANNFFSKTFTIDHK